MTYVTDFCEVEKKNFDESDEEDITLIGDAKFFFYLKKNQIVYEYWAINPETDAQAKSFFLFLGRLPLFFFKVSSLS